MVLSTLVLVVNVQDTSQYMVSVERCASFAVRLTLSMPRSYSGKKVGILIDGTQDY
jgi:hypothetical protein